MVSNRAKFVILALLVLIIANSAISASQQATAFVFVNIAKALMLHPLMAKLDVKEGRFELSALNKPPPKDRSLLQKDYIDRIAKLEKDLASVTKALEVLDQQFSKELFELDDLVKKINSVPAEARTPLLNEYNKKRGIIDRKYWRQRDELLENKKMISHKIDQLKKERQIMHLTTLDETQAVFGLILDDIYEAIDKVAKTKNFSMIINSSFTLERIPPNPNFVPENPMQKLLNLELKGPAEEVLFKHGESGNPPLYMTINSWASSHKWALKNCYDSRLDIFFIKGGLDITPEVVEYIYNKHNVNKKLTEVIKKYLQLSQAK